MNTIQRAELIDSWKKEEQNGYVNPVSAIYGANDFIAWLQNNGWSIVKLKEAYTGDGRMTVEWIGHYNVTDKMQ